VFFVFVLGFFLGRVGFFKLVVVWVRWGLPPVGFWGVVWCLGGGVGGVVWGVGGGGGGGGVGVWLGGGPLP